MADPTHATVLLLEELAANAVAPTVVQLVDGWLVRASPAVPFRRSNSVLPVRGDAHGLGERIALVEEFYGRRGLPVRYQLSPAAVPPELDDALEARGYRIEVASFVRTADTSRVIAARAAAGGGALVGVCDRVDDDWLAAHADAHGADEPARSRVAAYARLLGRLEPRFAAVAIRLPGAGVVGVGFVVVERGWAGVLGMGTTPAARRRGVASAILHAIAHAAHAAGATRLYLQVEEDNEPALALYARAGFLPAYRDHYRSLGVRAARG